MSEKEVRLSSDSDGSADAGDEGGEVERLSYDEAVVKYGSGRFLLFQFVLLAFATWSTAINNMGYIYIGATQKHMCQVPADSKINMTENGTYSIHYIADVCSYDVLARYSNGTDVTLEKEIKCDSWVYDQTNFALTMMSEWDLNSCGGKWKIYVATSMYMIGYLVGCYLLAGLSDRYGRSKMFLFSNIAMFVTGLAASYSVNLIMLIIMRFLLGIFTAGARNAAYAHVCEIVGVKYRAGAGMLHSSFYGMGALFTNLLAQYLHSWRDFQLVCSCTFLLGIPYYWLIGESPRWQLTQGDSEAANKYFIRSAKYNKVQIPEKLDVYLKEQPKKEGTILTLFRTPNIRHKTLIVSFIWFSVSIIAFGMSFNIGNLSGNIFTNSYILSGSSLFSVIGIWYVEWGRRNAIASALFGSACFSFILVLMETYEVSSIATAVLAMMGRFFMSITFSSIYVATAEIYPTTLRVTALGLGSSLARVGGALAPFIVYTNDFWPNMPYIIFLTVALIAGVVALKLPETKGRQIPDTIYQAEHEVPLGSIIWCRRSDYESESTPSTPEEKAIVLA